MLQVFCSYNFVVHVVFSMLNVLFFDISTYTDMCEVPSVAVFYSYFISCFPPMVFVYFEVVPVAVV